MYVCMYAPMSACIYYRSIYLSFYLSMDVCRMYVSMYASQNLCIYLTIHGRIYKYIYVLVYVCVLVRVCMHMYICMYLRNVCPYQEREREWVRCSAVIITFSSTLSLHCFDLTTSPNGGKSDLHIVGQPLPPVEPELHMHKILLKKLHVPISPHSSCKGCSNNSNTSNLQSTVPFKKKHSTGKRLDGLIGPFFWANQDDVESLTGASGCWPRSPQGRLGREARVPWRRWCPERPEMLKTISWRTWLAIIIEEASLNKEPLDLCRWYTFYIVYLVHAQIFAYII